MSHESRLERLAQLYPLSISDNLIF